MGRTESLLHRLAAAGLVAAMAAGGLLAEEADDEAGGGKASPDGPAASAPAPPETVSVEGELPFIPTSNTIVTRLPLALRLTPANVGVVNEAVLREQSAFLLGDALRNISGVNVQSFNNVTDLFFIRGFDAQSSSLVLTDGAPEPEVTFYQMYNVERVEVFKGPAGFLYGSNPMAGAVNIVRRQPQAGTFGRVGVTGGSYGHLDATVDYNSGRDDGSIAWRLNGAWRQSDYWRDRMENDMYAVNPSFTWRPSGDTSLNVNLEYVKSRFTPDSGLPLVNGEIADVDRETSYQSPFDFSDQDLGRFQVDLDHTVNERWRLRNKTYYRDLDWDSDGTLFFATFSPVPGTDLLFRGLALLDDRQQFMGNQAEAILSAPTGQVKHEVVMGVEVGSYADEFTLDIAPFLLPMDINDPQEPSSTPPAIDPSQSSAGDSRSFVVAPYVMDQIRFSEKFSALAGLRYDIIDFEDQGALVPGSTETTRISRSDGELSPMAGVVFSATPRVSFYANAGRSFAPPAPRVLDEDREPEESRQVEVGVKLQQLPGKMQMTIAAYRMERDNIGIPDDTGITQQSGDQLSRGAELEVGFEPRDGLRFLASYAYNDSELTEFTERVPIGGGIFLFFDRSGNTPAFAPRHLANLWVSQRFGNGLGVAGGGRYVSEQFIAEDNAYAIDGYVVYDAAVSYRRDRWEMNLNLKNVGDREYETRGFGTISVIPAAPFTAYAGVQYAF